MMTQWDLLQECKDGSISAIQSMGYTTLTKQMIESHDHLDRCKQSIDEIQPSFMETINKVDIVRTYLNIMEAIYNNYSQHHIQW